LKKKIALVLSLSLAVVLAASVLVTAIPAFAASQESQVQGQSQWQYPSLYRWQPFPVWPGWGYRPVPGTGLEYTLSYSPQKNELVLYVVNPQDKPVTVTTPTSQKVDFVLWRDGQMVWRASAGKFFSQVVNEETFAPYEGKVYSETLPWLPSGLYFAQGYFLGESKWAPCAATYIWIAAYEPLQYSVEYLGPSWFNPVPRLRVTIKNVSDRDITLPYQYGYQILVKRPGDKDYLPNVGMSQSIGTIAKGATRYVFVSLNSLEPGTYQVDVRSNVAHVGWYTLVARTWFYVW